MLPVSLVAVGSDSAVESMTGAPSPLLLAPTVPTVVAFLKEVESPYDVHDCIRSYLGDTLEAKEFAKQFLERRAKQRANHQRQQQQVGRTGLSPQAGSGLRRAASLLGPFQSL